MGYNLGVTKSTDELVQIYAELESVSKKLKTLLSDEAHDEAKLLLKIKEESRKIAELTARSLIILDKQ